MDFSDNKRAPQNPIGKTVRVIVDRPLGSRHPQYPDTVYPVNYGYVPDIPGGDGEEQDVYILGIDVPLESFTGPVIAVIHREDDAEEKWVTAPPGKVFTEAEIRRLTDFQERFFKIRILMS